MGGAGPPLAVLWTIQQQQASSNGTVESGRPANVIAVTCAKKLIQIE